MKHLLQIIPNQSNVICGVGDYSRLLASKLEANYSISTKYLVANTGNSSVSRFNKCDNVNVSALRALKKIDLLLIHFSGYGYHTKGLPLWLPRFIDQFKRMHPSIPVMTMFHELFINARLPSALGILARMQEYIARRIAMLSDIVRTNRQEAAAWLKKVSRKDSIVCSPVFSNLGEPLHLPLLKDRKRTLLLFQPSNTAIYWEAYYKIIKRVDPDEIIIAGKHSYVPDNLIKPYKIIGTIASEKASQLFEESRWILYSYLDGYLAKSGILAAAASHKTCCILDSANNSARDGLEQGKHFLSADDFSSWNDESLDQRVASNLHEWYQPHNIQNTAASYYAQFTRGTYETA